MDDGDAEDVLVDVPHDGILRISLNRPHRLNALDDAAVDAIHHALNEVVRNPSYQVVLLQSVGRAFCSGFDMNDYNGDPETRGGAVALVEQMNRLADVPFRLRSSRAVVVAAVRGQAVGGGFGLALGADVLLVGHSATFTLPQTRLGVLAAELGMSYLLPRIVGLNIAAGLMLRGTTLDAAGAVAAGLAAEAWPDAEVDDAAMSLAVNLCTRSANALASTKRLLMAGVESSNLATTIRHETEAQVLSNYSPELRTAIADRVSGR